MVVREKGNNNVKKKNDLKGQGKRPNFRRDVVITEQFEEDQMFCSLVLLHSQAPSVPLSEAELHSSILINPRGHSLV